MDLEKIDKSCKKISDILMVVWLAFFVILALLFPDVTLRIFTLHR